MMAAAVYPRSRGLWQMSLDWLAGVGVSITAAGLSLWRSVAVSEARTDEKLQAMRNDLKQQATDSRAFEKEVTEDLHITFERLNSLIVKMEVLANSQAVVNSMTVKTLESVMRKMEVHDMNLVQHGEDIAVLKRGGK